MYKRNLPAKPNLEQYKKIAKDIVKAWKSNAPATIPWEGSVITLTREHLRQKHPRLKDLSEDDAKTAEITLADAHYLIAREYGFENWAELANYINNYKPQTENTEPIDERLPEINEFFDARHPIAVSVVKAIQQGDIPEMKRLLKENPNLAKTKIINADGTARSLLHIATDWPGHFPNVAETIAVLKDAGADINARFVGSHTETPLHWAASSDDVAALDALLDAGADIEAHGAVLGGGSPLADAVGFGQWKSAHRLVERGAKTRITDEAALGMLENIKGRFELNTPPGQEEINVAFWYACHGGQREVADFLLEHNADINWLPVWEKMTPLDTAARNKFNEMAEWLRSKGAKNASRM